MEHDPCDVVVVGNGIIGLSIAFELSQRENGPRVSVIGPPAREGAASVAAGAMLNAFGEATVSTLAHPATTAKFAITRAALDAWPAWLGKLCDAARQTRRPRSLREGTFIILGATAGDETIRNFHAIRSALAAYEEPFEEISPEEIEGISPEANARPVRALHIPREGAIDAREVLALLEKALAANGVRLVPSTVEQLITADGQVQGVRLADGEAMPAHTVVVAAGSLAQRFIEQLPRGLIPPMLHGTGLAVQTQRTHLPGFSHVVRTPNHAGACGIHLVPLANEGHEYIGATNNLSFLPPVGPGVGVSSNLLRNACEQLDQRLAYSRIHRWLVGRRPVTLDGLPLMGRVAACAGLVFASGTYRDGLHSSPVIAQHIADVVLDSAVTHPHFDHFAPERPPIETTTMAGAIENFVAYERDSAIQVGIHLPYCVDPEVLTQHQRQTAKSLYDRLGEPVALLPEVLNALNNATAGGLDLLIPYFRSARERYGTAKPALGTRRY